MLLAGFEWSAVMPLLVPYAIVAIVLIVLGARVLGAAVSRGWHEEKLRSIRRFERGLQKEEHEDTHKE